MRFGIFSVLVLSLLALPLAGAQVPSTSPTSSLTIDGLPAAIQGLESNKTVEVPFTVQYRVTGNFLCAQAVNVPITIQLQQGATSTYITATVDPAEAPVTLDQGPHQGGSESAEGKIVLTLTEINANASVPLTITASAPAADCAPGIPAPEPATATTYANVTYEPPAAPPPPPAEETPGPGALTVALGVVAAAIVMRRRRA